MKHLRFPILILSLAAIPLPARADVKLPAVISDHMVVQADAAIPIWGWAEPGEEVGVSFAGQARTTRADTNGKWAVKFDKLPPAGEPQTLTVQGKNTIAVADVLVGEVWVGSGQSNMALAVGSVQNADEEMAAATFPAIRMFKVSSGASPTAQGDCQGSWQVCTPAAARQFSAAAYFFGRELHRTLGVPVGLINSSVGGTPIESWISPEAQKQAPELQAFNEAQAKAAPAFNAEAARAKYERDLAKWKEAAQKAKAEGQAPPRAPRVPASRPLVAARPRPGGRAPRAPAARAS